MLQRLPDIDGKYLAMGLSFVGKVRKQAKKHSRNWPPLAGKKFLKEKGLEFENENSLTHSKTSF